MPVTGVNPMAAQQLQMQAQQAAQQRMMMPPAGPAQSAFSPGGLKSQMAVGNNVYMGGLPNAPGAGRPRNPTPTFQDTGDPNMQAALQRRIQQYGVENQQHQAATKRR